MLHISLIALAAGLGEPIEPVLATHEFTPTTAYTAAPYEAAPYEPLTVFGDDDADSGGVGISYTFFELGFTEFDPDNVSDEADTYFARAGLGLGIFHIFGEYEQQEFDTADTDSNTFKLGAGVHFGLGDRLDIQGDAAWLYNDVSSDDIDLDDDTHGYELRVGLRWMALDWERGGLELEGNIVHRALDNEISDDGLTGVELAGRVHFLRFLSVGLLYTQLEDDSKVGLGARWSF